MCDMNKNENILNAQLFGIYTPIDNSKKRFYALQ